MHEGTVGIPEIERRPPRRMGHENYESPPSRRVQMCLSGCFQLLFLHRTPYTMSGYFVRVVEYEQPSFSWSADEHLITFCRASINCGSSVSQKLACFPIRSRSSLLPDLCVHRLFPSYLKCVVILYYSFNHISTSLDRNSM